MGDVRWRRTIFLPDFARLLEHAEFVDGIGDRVAGRSCLKGEFRGRRIAILLQHGNEDSSPTLVVAMETHAAADIYDFADFKADRAVDVADRTRGDGYAGRLDRATRISPTAAAR